MEDNIKKLSIALLVIFYILLISLPLIILIIWFLPNFLIARTLLNIGFHPIAQGFWQAGLPPFELFSFKSKCIGFLGSLTEFLPFLLALLTLIKVFRNYSNGNIFSLSNVKSYQWLGCLFFIDSLLAKPISQILLSYSFSLNTPRLMFVGFGLGIINVESIFCGIIIFVIAKVMYLAHKMQEEEKLII